MDPIIYIRSMMLRWKEEYASEYWASLPAVQTLRSGEGLSFTSPVTFIVGENGIGKSTLLEALAVALGFNPEGGTMNFSFSTKDSHSSLCDAVTIVRGAFREKDGFFLRAESVYTTLTYFDSLPDPDGHKYDLYGGRSLHTRSHGEAFMTLANIRFKGRGLYILDEPESALSVTRQFELMTKMKELVDKDSQFIVCTHSPILMAYPGASILELSSDGIRQVPYEQTSNYQITKYFLNNYRSMLREMGFDDIGVPPTFDIM